MFTHLEHNAALLYVLKHDQMKKDELGCIYSYSTCGGEGSVYNILVENPREGDYEYLW